MKSKDLIQQEQTAAAQAIKNAADTGTTQELGMPLLIFAHMSNSPYSKNTELTRTKQIRLFSRLEA